MDVLLHNIGHHDLYLVLDLDGPEVVAIRNVKMWSLAGRLRRHLVEAGPLRPRPGGALGACDLPAATALGLSRRDLADALELTDRQEQRVLAHATGQAVVGVHLPILPVVARAWQREAAGAAPQTVLLACSDTEAPADKGRSTAEVARILADWLAAQAPAAVVQVVEGLSGDPFRFDGATAYVRDGLVPVLEHLERQVQPGPDGRPLPFRLCLSLSTGTLPVVWAISAATRRLRPALLHVPRARSRPELARDHDVEHQPFAVLEQAHEWSLDGHPSEEVRAAAVEMRQFVQGYRPFAPGGERHADGDLGFWLRKSGSPVLAVVVAREPDGSLRAFRGCNLEVSLPTGSMCAERSAIAQALAARPDLRRADLKAVAVLGLGRPWLEPCGVCSEWLDKVAEVNSAFRVVTFADETCRRGVVRAV